MSDSSEAEVVKRPRVVRKRAVRASRTESTARVGATERTTRTRAPRKAVEAPVEREEKVEKIERKAPTPIANRKASSKSKRNQLIVVGVLLALGIGASAVVGFTDDGRIDVNRAIEERNERIRNGQITENELDSILVPVQNTTANQLPDGGLVGLGIGAEPPPPAPDLASSSASSTASSTEETASSTDSVSEEETETNDSREESNDAEITEPAPETEPESVPVTEVTQ